MKQVKPSKKLLSIPKDTILEVCVNTYSANDAAKLLGIPPHPRNCKYINDLMREFSLSYKYKSIKYELAHKECPVCSNKFITKIGHPREKTVCSRACSNTYFRSGPSNPNWRDDTYQSTCFYYWEKKCIVCAESNIIEVHHFDENHENNEATNLVPLCPTHHQYMHSRFKHLIDNEVTKYVNNRVLDSTLSHLGSPLTRKRQRG